MKNMKLIMTCVILVLILSATFIKLVYFKNNPIENVDTINFEQEYENLNNNEKYMDVDIPSDNPMIYATYNDIEKIITEGTGVIYFGFPECPWCRNVVPQLISSAKDVGLDKIYYFNALEIRDIKTLDENGNIVIEKEGTEEYSQLVNMLYEYLEPYEGLNDDTIKRLYFPTVVFVKNGKIIGIHIGSVDSQENPMIPLNELQIEELKEIYSKYMLEVLGIVCDTEIKDKC